MPNEWKNGLCSCMPCGLCMKSYFCPCILVGQNHARIHKGTQKEDACSGWCAGWCGLTSCLGLGWILQMMDRMEMQDKHNLEGGGCGACCKSFWCGCCMNIQMSKELDYIQLQQQQGGYASNQGMVAKPQQYHG
ncbi:hypothetical protein GLAREA_05588 [Glarea lozoyensis ATCC 20868]|uniref:PLAC8 family protein n=1 Tax=Glarea lozoyensis (strain ATCC 20868 / MF5171) TaxID=1116229 RepID=S3DET0_GLAL2|nr:uncharacterized protein GLAREA_05588 [Glarea lozoyensis ATCC 20868]EPE36250.1 hypothetical protein GLAREA_05588 [Glarea lozoyensis ATCC 20868]